MTLFGIRHTIRWAVFNATEFDRRHLHGAGVWLFGRRPVRPQRPPRRIVAVLFAAAYLSFLTSAASLAQVALMAGEVAGLLLVLGTVLFAVERLKRRHRG